MPALDDITGPLPALGAASGGWGRELLGTTRAEVAAQAAGAQRDWRTPGLSIGIIRDGGLVHTEHIGSARLDPASAAGDDTPFLVGPLTTTVTALTVMSLRDDGRLDLEDALSTHLPGVRHGDLTLRQLLSHTSGLQRHPPGGGSAGEAETPGRSQVLADLDRAEQVLPVHHEFHYSSLGYALLGLVVERVDGGDWETAASRRVLEPLGMADTALEPDESRRAHGHEVHPYTGLATQVPARPRRALSPESGLWSTLADLARYTAFLASPDEAVLHPDTLDEMCRPVVMTDLEGWRGAQGLGFDMERIGERILVGHGGRAPGFSAGLRLHRPSGVGAVVLTSSSAGCDPLGLAGRLVSVVLDAEPEPPRPWAPPRRRPDWEPLLGPWWGGGSEVWLVVGDDSCLWVVRPGRPAGAGTRLEPEGPGRFRATAGPERGELLEVLRGEDGQVEELCLAGRLLCRRPGGPEGG